MKKAIVIGASSGIGRGLAQKLVAKGFRVGITGRRLNLLQELQAENPTSYVIKSFDIKDAHSIPLQLSELVKELGGLDLLIINSGAGHRNEALHFEIEEPAILTNILGFTAVADWAYGYFKQENRGHLAIVSSIAGLRGNRFAPAYSASKAYQINYMEGLRQKAKHAQLRVTFTDIRPGFVDTAMAQGDRTFWVATVDKATSQIMRALEQRKEVVYVTKRWRLIACLIPFIPRWFYERM